MLSSTIESYDDINGYAAQTSFILFALQNDCPPDDYREALGRGFAACEAVAEGKRLIDSQPTTYEDRNQLMEFMSFAEKKKVDHMKIFELAQEAQQVKEVLRSLDSRQPVEPGALESAIRFFRKLYSYT